MSRSLFKAAWFLLGGQVRTSESIVSQALQQALQLVQCSSRDPLIAHCKYWLGRIEWLRGSETKAYQYFYDIQPWVKDILQGEEVSLYLEFLKPGPEKDIRQRTLLTQHLGSIYVQNVP
ncbi:hypothetical protein BDV33DRAFT_104505 [Aspergillus novoparasiticus]|uniref:Uncharacterized protein n=1 Tax=Aspergillus novoparasiticus TaxID=986946 RepID=A0A5N6ESW4_9EURO|nr:hypothetical protein BDV33DRAFT_104505 [Aspergillus novoparasiticus]